MRSLSRGALVAAAAAAAALAVTLAGCGSTHAGAGAGASSPAHASGSPAAASPSPAAPRVSLVITVIPRVGAPPVRWTLTCGPVGGSHPDAAAACAALGQVKDPFAPIPRGVMCPMIAAGPQTATISGVWNGEPVSSVFSKRNGCETNRWNRIGPIFGTAGAGTSVSTGVGGQSSAG